MEQKYTLEEARKIIAQENREFLAAHWLEGVDCPTCKQYVRCWSQSLHSKQGSWLIALAKEYQRTNDWVSIKELNHTAKMLGGDYAKLRYWGLVEQATNKDIEKRASGFWRPTTKGLEFIQNKIKLPKTVHTYDGVPRRFDGDEVNIINVLGKKFNYEELMNS